MNEEAVEVIGPEPQRRDSHVIAVSNFNGDPPDLIEADEYFICVPTKDCIQFWATLISCFIVATVSLILMIVRGPGDPTFYLWEGLFAFAFGVLVPSPNYGTAFKVPKPTQR